MTPNQKEQKDRARAEAENHQQYSAVDGIRDYKALSSDDERNVGFSDANGNYDNNALRLKVKNPENNDEISHPVDSATKNAYKKSQKGYVGV